MDDLNMGPKEIFEKLEKHHLREFDRQSESKSDNARSLDNVIFVISTGVFVLSINYILGSKTGFVYQPMMLIISWLSLILGIISHIFSYRYAIKFADEVQSKLSIWAKNGYLPVGYNPSEEKGDIQKFKFMASRFNNITLSLTIMGIILLFIFVSINFIKNNNNIINKTEANPFNL
jgi:hypothetical protein